jgi:hypothetical protein
VERFGHVVHDDVELSDEGRIVHDYWYEIPNHFENVRVGAFVVMPNHIHGIVEIVGASIHGAQRNTTPYSNVQNTNVQRGGITGKMNPMGTGSLGEIIRWFKGRASFGIRGLCDDAPGAMNRAPTLRVWQR